MLRAFFLLGLLLTGRIFAAETYVAFRPDLPAGSAYVIETDQLHPTQLSLGWREVQAKTAAINRLTPPALIVYLQDKNVPVVIGPGGIPYMTDGHHTLRSLLESAQPAKKAYGHILANWRDLEAAAFWTKMQANNFTNLKDEHGLGPQPPEQLPTKLTHMRRDPYRGLTWAVMKAGGFTERKEVFFQEFFWADYLRDKVTWNDADDTDFARAVREALALVHAPAARELPGYLPGPAPGTEQAAPL